MHLGMVTDITIAFDDSEASLKISLPPRKSLTENTPSCIFRLREYMAVMSGYGHPFRLGTIKIQRS